MDPIREHLVQLLDWEAAHVTFDAAVEGIPPAVRGQRPEGMPHSPWELIEHIRLAQRDILEFARDAEYRERRWPEDYWPGSPAPASEGAWTDSLRDVRGDRAALQALARDGSLDLLARIPHGNGQTLLRELLLVADHTAYHVGQLVLVRRALGCWPAA